MFLVNSYLVEKKIEKLKFIYIQYKINELLLFNFIFFYNTYELIYNFNLNLNQPNLT